MDKRKRVGILTFHRAINYGAALQAYALLSCLNRSGYNAEIINFIPEGHYRTTGYFPKKISGSSLKQNVRSLMNRSVLKRRDEAFCVFAEQYMNLNTVKPIGFDEMESVLKQYDAVICGSDQIWNPDLSDADEAFFLPFEGSYRRIAYGISTGSGRLCDYAHPQRIRECIREYSALSFRDEASLQSLYRFYSPNNAPEIVCDPTLLHDRSFYESIADKERYSEQPYIFLYTVNGRMAAIDAADRLSEETGTPYYTMPTAAPNKTWDRLGSHVPDGSLSPQAFLSWIRDAEYIVTDSYHGAVFSLLFGKKFCIIATEDESGNPLYDSRIMQLCKDFSAEDRYLRKDGVCTAVLDTLHVVDTEEHRKALAEKAEDYLQRSINGTTMQSSHNALWDEHRMICPVDLCTSCGACRNACPEDAVRMIVIDDRRRVPEIDRCLCIECNQCREVCPNNQPVQLNSIQKLYAVQWKNRHVSIQSSTSGIASLLARVFTEEGGFAYGAGIDEDLCVRHYGTDDPERTERMRGSKYVQSDTGLIFRDVRDKLNQGYRVLFTGTPCQIAGLRNYLGGEEKNLYCIDLICHGAPPMKYLEDHLKSSGIQMDTYRFRGGSDDQYITYMNKNETVYRRPWWKDQYYSAYNDDFIIAENCFSCIYAAPERAGDMTLGDFWKIDRNMLSRMDEGRIGLAAVNTEKGCRLWDMISSEIVYSERVLSEAYAGNPNLLRPTEPSPLRRDFMRQYRKTQSFTEAFAASAAYKAYKQRIFELGWTGRKITRILRVISEKHRHTET